jgi:hypothetical protein
MSKDVKKMHLNEDRFWANILIGSNPGWSVQMTAQQSPKQSGVQSPTAYLYAYDVSYGWNTNCAVPQESLLEAQAIQSRSPKLRDIAVTHGHHALIHAHRKSENAPEIERRAMVLNLFYMAQTNTFQVVQTRYPDVSGHWMTLIYRFKSGHTMLRPAFKSNFVGGNRLSPGQIKQWASDISAEDEGYENSGLMRQIQSGNELLTAKAL